ncbi:unnamed protein product [Effrenium voratum]|uniref:Uncharacterized protein n=1 Tax=Effrenium voratum TaxID=2562239 RepID=A0AA36J4E4_9DINO|nr:unnamed protein product [Effrenium voratum]CAJ1398355.1 unnamed protein product [Effrenium voratum]CAJ1420613.1 unnamed protein product [Effrenium voratum]CAJ1420614.1 unnamed protein product [Effrenium voratum]|mmetsp:Transcript_29704/g.70605  ORF Transcript_29704/g.70605 Transcript_29704/m.70605 type:complete len:147 (+) Transcript_29704:84-524(+)|eukprot:CAMPEP_0181426140 /NCGR_PEP_ID=MMETSP1110-20121109/15512_1 /TAXON_ID=174948 /ORGANISM="Symbiodinium sp., Strain CCMP421" /LENGTH=146 /DNA_ID=CAMNT_0023549331 /DNA_START=62 /DNA_END=502 /DNA_ORIENTATION=+
MALFAKLIGCGVVLLALSSVQSFVPAVYGKHEAPKHNSFATLAAPEEQLKVNTESSTSMMPLAFGLTIGLALALPQRALAASTGNEDVATFLDRIFNKEALGAFGIAGLSWNWFYLAFGLSGAGVLALAIVLSAALSPARTLKDKA